MKKKKRAAGLDFINNLGEVLKGVLSQPLGHFEQQLVHAHGHGKLFFGGNMERPPPLTGSIDKT